MIGVVLDYSSLSLCPSSMATKLHQDHVLLSSSEAKAGDKLVGKTAEELEVKHGGSLMVWSLQNWWGSGGDLHRQILKLVEEEELHLREDTIYDHQYQNCRHYYVRFLGSLFLP